MLKNKLKRYLNIVIKDLCKRTIVNGKLYGKNELVNRMEITYTNLNQRVCLKYDIDYEIFSDYCEKTYGIYGDDTKYVWVEYIGHLSFISYV